MKVLVKVCGKSPSRAAVHAYDVKHACAVCSQFIVPGGDWEVREHGVERYEQLPYIQRCDHCLRKLKPKSSLLLPRPSTAREQKHERELAALARWEGRNDERTPNSNERRERESYPGGTENPDALDSEAAQQMD